MRESGEQRHNLSEIIPQANISRGLYQVNIPELGQVERGKVRDNYVVTSKSTEIPNRVIVTTDRTSAFDRVICTIPGKGQILNLLSTWWFEQVKDIIPNHMRSVDGAPAIPHPNVAITHQAEKTLPVEMVVRGYMAKSSTSTSLYKNYMDGQRDIYGHSFPDGLVANQKLPTGAVVTPTTKAEQGMHDEMLTREQAKALVDSELGEGMWDKAEQLSLELFERQARIAEEKGLILADTKYEMGIVDGQLILIDEVGTPDSSRFWLLSTYDDRMKEGKTPDGFDKEILRRWLADQGFTGNEPIPEVPQEVIDAMAQAYKVPFEMLTGTTLPESDATSSTVQEATADYLTEHGVL